jgi:hypothetical protein
MAFAQPFVGIALSPKPFAAFGRGITDGRMRLPRRHGESGGRATLGQRG